MDLKYLTNEDTFKIAFLMKSGRLVDIAPQPSPAVIDNIQHHSKHSGRKRYSNIKKRRSNRNFDDHHQQFQSSISQSEAHRIQSGQKRQFVGMTSQDPSDFYSPTVQDCIKSEPEIISDILKAISDLRAEYKNPGELYGSQPPTSSYSQNL